MADTRSAKLHLAMLPWLAYGHFIPFLHLSNKLAERGHKVSFLIPKTAQPKLKQFNQYPSLIQFYPIVVPHVDRLPPGAETTSDVPYALHNRLSTAFDRTQAQVESILRTLKPQFVFYDFAFWVPALACKLSFKSIFYMIASATSSLFIMQPKAIREDITLEELIEETCSLPTSVRPRSDLVSTVRGLAKLEYEHGLSLYDRLNSSLKGSDAIAARTCREVEGPACDYIAQKLSKPVMLTGHVLPETSSAAQLEEKWDNWLKCFNSSSVVFCAFGTQIILQKDQFQELLLGFEQSGLPFLLALTPPQGCATIEEALPQGFAERVEGRGWVSGDWVPQPLILKHPSVGCFVNHCGPGTMWESLLSDCQIVLIPHLGDQIVSTMLLAEELKVAVEVKKEENGWITKESLSKSIKSVMDKDSVLASVVKSNHVELKNILSSKDVQESCITTFIQCLQDLLETKALIVVCF